MELGLELGFLCFPPSCQGCPFPSPTTWEQMCCLCQSWQPPPHTPGSCTARASSPPPLLPPPPPGLAPCHWGWRWNHPPTRPASPVTLPPSSLPQVSLLENSRQMSAGERWACGPGAELQLGLGTPAGPSMGKGLVSARLQGNSLGRATAPGVLNLNSLGKARVASTWKGVFLATILKPCCTQPPAGRWNIQNLTVNSKQSL